MTSGQITVRYWASVRAAAGVDSETLDVAGPETLAGITERVAALHPGNDLRRVLSACSVLIGETPVGSSDPASVSVAAGSVVEFLPPFAGG